MPVPEQQVHDRAGERTVSAGLYAEEQVCLLCRVGQVGVDHHNLCATRLSRMGRVSHDVDLGIDRIGAPDDHHIRHAHFARIRAA